MEITLDRRALEWQTKARTFAEQELQPWELEAEFNNGVIPLKSVSATGSLPSNSASAGWTSPNVTAVWNSA